MTEEQTKAYHAAIGQAVIELLNLPIVEKDRVVTTWGTKTALGLGACICRLIDEEEDEKRFLEDVVTLKANIPVDDLRGDRWHDATHVTVK